MISDVLFDAIEQIREYQRKMPHAYDEFREDIDKVVAEMVRLKTFFDTPPTTM